MLSEDRIAPPLTITLVKDDLHVVFANLDSLTLDIAKVSLRDNSHTLETIDAVGIYPGDLSFFGMHAYSVHAGQQHLIYVDQQQTDALIPKWIKREQDEDSWWVTTPEFEGTPIALLTDLSGELLLVAETHAGLSFWTLPSVSESGRHQLEQMVAQPRKIWPLRCLEETSFIAIDANGTLALYRANESPKTLVSKVGANYAVCYQGTAYVLWHSPSTGEVLFAPLLSDDRIGSTTAVTLARGTSSVYLLPNGKYFSFVLDELIPDDNSTSLYDLRRIILIHPEQEHEKINGYNKSILSENVTMPAFTAAHLDDLLIIVEHQDGLRAKIFPSP